MMVVTDSLGSANFWRLPSRVRAAAFPEVELLPVQDSPQVEELPAGLSFLRVAARPGSYSWFRAAPLLVHSRVLTEWWWCSQFRLLQLRALPAAGFRLDCCLYLPCPLFRQCRLLQNCR